MDGEGKESRKRKECPYLDTIDRQALDFDFEQSCSVTLETGPHIYGCLVCGKFFRGRGRQTPAFTHSVDENHCVYIHLKSGKFYCLPDNYEIVNNPSLMDIKLALHPRYTSEEISKLDQQMDLARDLRGKQYLPGYVGLNNLQKTDYVNAVIQAIAHVPPIRNYFLMLNTSTSNDKINNGNTTGHQEPTAMRGRKSFEYSRLALSFADLMRKMWSHQRFKCNVDPHEMIQAISSASKKRFHVGKQGDAAEFLTWFLHQLHLGIGGHPRKAGTSIIHTTFQGVVEVTTRQSKRAKPKTATNIDEDDDRDGSDDDEEQRRKEAERQAVKTAPRELVFEESIMTTNFLHLTLEIPEKPLFKDENGGLVIPQEPLVTVLQKFNGTTFLDVVLKNHQQAGTAPIVVQRRYRLKKLPNYLILHLARFKKNNFYSEKNPTIVAFPLKNLDMKPYVHHEEETPLPTNKEIDAMTVKELKQFLSKNGQADLGKNCVERNDLLDIVKRFVSNNLTRTKEKYDLVANICHVSPVVDASAASREGQTADPLELGSYKCHVQHKGSGQWYEMQDLRVQEVMPQLIGLSESYVLIFQRKGLLITSS